jgi:hypothetical protein
VAQTKLKKRKELTDRTNTTLEAKRAEMTRWGGAIPSARLHTHPTCPPSPTHPITLPPLPFTQCTVALEPLLPTLPCGRLTLGVCALVPRAEF